MASVGLQTWISLQGHLSRLGNPLGCIARRSIRIGKFLSPAFFLGTRRPGPLVLICTVPVIHHVLDRDYDPLLAFLFSHTRRDTIATFQFRRSRFRLSGRPSPDCFGFPSPFRSLGSFHVFNCLRWPPRGHINPSRQMVDAFLFHRRWRSIIGHVHHLSLCRPHRAESSLDHADLSLEPWRRRFHWRVFHTVSPTTRCSARTAISEKLPSSICALSNASQTDVVDRKLTLPCSLAFSLSSSLSFRSFIYLFVSMYVLSVTLSHIGSLHLRWTCVSLLSVLSPLRTSLLSLSLSVSFRIVSHFLLFRQVDSRHRHIKKRHLPFDHEEIHD